MSGEEMRLAPSRSTIAPLAALTMSVTRQSSSRRAMMASRTESVMSRSGTATHVVRLARAPPTHAQHKYQS